MNSSRQLLFIAIMLGIASSVCPIQPGALMKRSLLRNRLLAMPSALRPKRQLFREDIPHHRPLTGNTYYLHAGFPHPSRWYEGSQSIAPNPNPITHHHFDKKPGLHDDTNNDHHHHDHHNNQVNNEDEQKPIHPVPPSQQLTLDQHQQLHQHQHHHYHQDPHNIHSVHSGGDPYSVSVVNNKSPHSVNIHSSIVHSNGVGGGDNGLGNISPPAPVGPVSQANFDPLLSHYHEGPPDSGHVRQVHTKPIEIPPPTQEPYTYDDYSEHGGGDYKDVPQHQHHGGAPESHHQHHGGLPESHHQHHGGPPESHHQHHGGLPETHHQHHGGIPETHHFHPPVDTSSPDVHTKVVERKPKTIIHYHPVTVGNIINFNDDNKPEIVTPNPLSYGPPQHVPGVPLSDKDPMLSIAEPFIKSPFKTVPGLPSFMNFGKDEHAQYGPPRHIPGPPLGDIDLSPMLPSFGPPIKPETESPPYGAALPVIAHLHTEAPQHHHHHHHHQRPRRPKHPRKGRGPRPQQHLHLHHIHHPPAAPPPLAAHQGLGSPFFNAKPSYVVHGHVPSKFHSFHSPHFRSHSHSTHSHHHHHKSIWSW